MHTLLNILGSIILALTAIALLLFSAGLFLHRLDFYKKAIRTTGTVIRIDSSRTRDGYTSYAPVYEFRTYDGETITKRHDTFTSPPQYQVGQSIDLLYYPEYPSVVEIHGKGDLFKTPIFVAFIGVVAALGVVSLWTN